MADVLPPLNQIDPAEAWQPWQPSAADPWGRKWAAHLYRRAAFGPSRDELLEAERLGPQGTLDLLLNGRPQCDEILQTLVDVGQVAAARDNAGDLLRGWWIYCMLHSGHPLREKLTLFWHNHFATSIAKVQDPEAMFRQNCLLRHHALGKFGPFLQAMSKDKAMLIWLDSNSNVKGKPNENYARELMELFSLGVGNYTEKDVREGARAFTGWHTVGEGFRFEPRYHDDGSKTFLGKTGLWNGDDVVRIVLEQPAAARFLVRKLYTFLISEHAEPPDSLLQPLCDSFRKSDYDVAALVKTMLASRHFYSGHAFRRRIKWPVEFVLGAARTVYRLYGEAEADYRPLQHQALVRWIEATGQSLFAPPNVKGWPAGQTWLNTSTVLERNNFAEALAMGTLWGTPVPEPTVVTAAASNNPAKTAVKPSKQPRSADTPEAPVPPKAFDSARILHEEAGEAGRFEASAEEVVRTLLEMYLPGGARPEARARLVAFVADGQPSGSALHRRVREIVHAILTMAEYQLA
jgi:hypothetical protein